ncbi:MAG: thiol-disulfide oxidoreductase DCC family protein [Cytophagales bacterium]|nr:MAG: thiol-disulfide oxidoreductase DCC family protein [Cytophagales bacterium]
MEKYANKNIVLFDGVCNLCNGAVNFLIDHDKNNVLYFASLQSDFGQEVLKDYGMKTNDFDTFVFLKNGKPFTRSQAALEVLHQLGGGWSSLYLFRFVPSFVRDSIYKLVAKNRYRLFGQREACRMPTPELKAKFL